VARPSVPLNQGGYSYILFSESLKNCLSARMSSEPLVGRSHPFLEGRPNMVYVINSSLPRGANCRQLRKWFTAVTISLGVCLFQP
jgi:hypothetical protein